MTTYLQEKYLCGNGVSGWLGVLSGVGENKPGDVGCRISVTLGLMASA
jgi:hypothetical protein